MTASTVPVLMFKDSAKLIVSQDRNIQGQNQKHGSRNHHSLLDQALWHSAGMEFPFFVAEHGCVSSLSS